MDARIIKLKGYTFLIFLFYSLSPINAQVDTAYTNALDLRARAAFYAGDFEKNILLTDSLANAFAAGGDYIGYAKFNLYNGWTNFNQLKDYQKALRHAEIVQKTVEGQLAGQFRFIHDMYGLFAGVYLQTGNPEKALEYEFLALKKIVEQGVQNTFSDHDVQSNIGTTYMQMERWEEALTYLTKAKSIFIKVMDKEGWGKDYRSYYRAAQLQANLAECYIGLNEPSKALEEALAGLSYAEKGEKENTFPFHGLYFALANAYSINGQIKEADQYFQLVEEIYSKNFGVRSTQMALVQQNLSRHLERQNELQEALDHNGKALQIIGFKLSPDQLELKALQGESNCKSCEADFLDQRVQLLWKLSRQEEKKPYLQACLNTVQRSLESLKKTRQTLLFREGSKHRLFEQFQSILKRGCAAAREMYELSRDSRYLSQAFELVEQSKANLLLEALVISKVETFVDLPAEVLKSERQLSLELVRQERLLEDARAKKDSFQVTTIQNGALFESKQKYEAFFNKLQADYPNYFAARHEVSVASMQELQQAVPASDLFVNYLLNKEDGILQIFVSDHEYTNAIAIPWKRDYEQLIEQYYRSLQQTSLIQSRKRQQFITQSHQLYQLLLAPIQSRLEGKKRLIIAADDLLNYLPFETLMANDQDGSFTELDFLIKKIAVSYHYSGTIFLESRQRKVKTSQSLLAFAPVFQNGEETTQVRNAHRSLFDLDLNAIRDGRFSPLPWSEKEVKNIATLFKEGDYTVLLNEKAKESALKEAMEKGHQYLHLASHSFANKSNPRFSGIACTQEEDQAPSEDGVLYINEIYNQPIKADLVILSSCESGIGQLVVGEGMLGINRSFIYSGVPNVLYSLWKVDDRRSSDLMFAFYQALVEGAGYPEALRTAKLKLLEDPQTALPIYWSAFTLIGR